MITFYETPFLSAFSSFVLYLAIEQLKAEDFSVSKAFTGEIIFDAPKNGDRLNFYPTLVRLIKCTNSYQFTNLSLDDTQAYDLACRER